MNAPALKIPSPAALEAILRKVTGHLAGQLSQPTAAAPDWSDLEWGIARAVAAMHGISPLLSRTLRWQGPAGWAAFLEGQRSHTAARYGRISRLLELIDARAREAGVAVLALKGAALHELGLYEPGERPMADIDLLVRPADAPRMAGLLASLGYRETRKTWKEREFSPMVHRRSAELGEHADNAVKLELHECIRERLPRRVTDISRLVFPAKSSPGLNRYSSTSALMMHLLFHAAGAMPTRALRMLQLHDIALLAARMTAAEWQGILARSSGEHGLWWVFPPLELTARYYPAAIPAPVIASFAAECPGLLARVSRRRSLYEVSFSYPWVDAFPGIEWSQSILDALTYAAGRLLPGGQQVALRKHAAENEAWGSRNHWTHLSQGRRILRWVAARPLRPPTLYAVRAAVAQAR